MSRKSKPPVEVVKRASLPWLAYVLCVVVGLGAGVAWAPLAGQSMSRGQDPAAAAAAKDVETQIYRYFSSWSERDLPAYEACFHSSAHIWFVGKNGPAVGMPLKPFIESQREAHARSAAPMKEYPLEVHSEVRNGLAHVWVHWQLETGKEISRGYDFFTLSQLDGKWLILSLVYNGESP